MERNGASLKKIRLEKGISLEEAHKKTKIHLDILRAIEEDDFINLSPVYVKGFIKIYSNFLGVDRLDYIPGSKEAKTVSRIAPPPKEGPDKQVQDEPGLKMVWPHAETRKKIIRIIFIIIVVITALNILFNLGRMLAQKISLIRARRTAISAAKKENKDAAGSTKTTAAASTKAKTTTTPPAPSENKTISGIRLVIRARENSWMQVKIDGRVIFQNILKKGRSESWEAKEKIELSLGNVGVLDLEINGKLIPSLGRKGQALKNILITKEGLSVKR